MAFDITAHSASLTLDSGAMYRLLGCLARGEDPTAAFADIVDVLHAHYRPGSNACGPMPHGDRPQSRDCIIAALAEL